MNLKKMIHLVVLFLTVLIVNNPVHVEAGFLKSLHNLQGIRYPEDYKAQIAQSPESIRGDFLLISDQNVLLTDDRYIFWYGKKLPGGVQPAFTNKLCEKYGGVFLAFTRHPMTNKRLTYEQHYEAGNDTVAPYTCEKNDNSVVFSMAMKRGMVLVEIYPPYIEPLKKEELQETDTSVGILALANKKGGMLDVTEISRLDDHTVQRLVPLRSDNKLMYVIDDWNKYMSITIPSFCKAKGGALYKVLNDSELQPFPVTLYESNRVPSGWPDNMLGDYVCKGGSEEFTYKVADLFLTYGNRALPTAKVYFSDIVKEGLLSLPVSGQKIQDISALKTEELHGALPSGTEELLAVEVAQKKTNVFKVVGMQEFTGIYNGASDGGCYQVSVEKVWDPTLPKPRVDLHNYNICNGRIAKSSETKVPEVSAIIDSYVNKVARSAQKLGKSEMEHNGYTIKAQALRDRDQCVVEVKIFEGINLIATREVNGCL